MVVDGDGEVFFGFVLAYDVFVEMGLDFFGFSEFELRGAALADLFEGFFGDFVGLRGAVFAYEAVDSAYEYGYLFSCPATERAFVVVDCFCHCVLLLRC